jgi:type I restriction enzyme M protein
VEIVHSVTRLCAMNLLLHNVGPTPQELEAAGGADQGRQDARAGRRRDRRAPARAHRRRLRELGSERFDVVLTNPPFGRKSSILVVGEDGDTEREQITYEREDFWATTQQAAQLRAARAKSLLTMHGRAAVVVPDNVLFEGGAGETIRRGCCKECDVHTLLRLPTGIFYAQGVKANVLFFDRKPASPNPGRASSGSTTCAPTSTSRSRPTPSSAATSTRSWRSTSPGRHERARRRPMGGGAPTTMRSWCSATSAASTSSG